LIFRAGHSDIVVIDARSRDAYAAGHIPGAVSFPHREMTAESTAQLDRSKVYVVYCDGIGCNASTKGAYKLARLGFRAKELLGGIDWRRRDGHPVAVSHEPGSLLTAQNSRQLPPDAVETRDALNRPCSRKSPDRFVPIFCKAKALCFQCCDLHAKFLIFGAPGRPARSRECKSLTVKV
jgi:rhodanese-related sulfurtransferase